MLIMLVTAGSRGDVMPLLALHDRAAASGHTVVSAVTREFVAEAEQGGRSVVPLDGDYERLARAQGTGVLTALRSYRSVIKPMLEAIQTSAARAVADVAPDVVVYHPKIVVAPVAAAAVGAVAAAVEIVPVLTPTRAYPAAGVVSRDLGRANRVTFAAASAGSAAFRGVITATARELGVSGRPPTRPDLSLCPVSPALLPRPDDWPPTSHLTGPWIAESDPGPLPDEIEKFVEGGSVVYAGFGSMVAGDAERRARVVIGAVRDVGARVLVAQGWGGLRVPDDLRGDDVLVVESVDHRALLPRVDAVIHHGGAGTVHAATRAGAVSVVVPFLADQPWWAALLHRRGLAPVGIPARGLTRASLAQALRETERYRDAIDEVAAQMRTEDGTAAALEIIERAAAQV